ncbi:unnamed protein product [Rotaria magnacalcarata]|uniref:Uncharacterized protein n=1 Tax=Rotaria magnacalcarata TaxID=392030 RepID=A0A819PQ38_9BILA|nr:unnamed protein product [Rotaria magnacalcarata]CAF2151281.1 unnamed protein product [Rotaria magnacalcarata]CAF4016797.1 unnamed protein product [Rotaria magnacalcarata]CAF4070146.1 unnamed protein product [Rotaria magnacalcarata]
MDQNFDNEDLHFPSEHVLPFATTSYTNNTHPRLHNRSRSIKSRKNNSSYTQNEDLCDTHFIKLKVPPIDQVLCKQEESNELVNGIRKIYDGQQYPRICADANCTVILQDNSRHQNGLCPNHYHESCSKTLSAALSSSRKRRRHNSPSSSRPSQVPMTPNMHMPTLKNNHRLSIASIPPSVDINNPKKGDIIEMENGSRKKFDGVVWRKICSLPDCIIAAQRDELCRKHYIKLHGKPNNESINDSIESANIVIPQSKSISSISTSSMNEKAESRTLKKLNDESMDYDEQQDLINDNTSNSYHASDDETQINQENSSIMREDNFDGQIDRTLIDALSACRQKFLTNYLKKWLQENRNHPYPSNQEKIDLAKQSSITYDQVTTWFNNARAILRRRQIKQRNSSNNGDDDSSNESNDGLDSYHNISSRIQRSLSLFNGVCCRSIGIQCNTSTVNQTTSTLTDVSMMTDGELLSDRTVRIIRPSNYVLKTNNSMKRDASQEFLINDIKHEDNDEGFRKNTEIIITSTCLDDDQMIRLKKFCSRFNIKLSNVIDEYTTHLITAEEDETLVCPLSKKVIQAVARHMYILTYRWIDTCLTMNKIINEKIFEIQGDSTLSPNHNGMQRSRQSNLAHNLPASLLFEKFSIMLKCDGCQKLMNNNELIELVKLSGAKHTIESYFSRLQTGLIRIVLCEKEYLVQRKEIYEKCIHIGIHFLSPEWFLESLVQYRIQPFEDYQILP